MVGNLNLSKNSKAERLTRFLAQALLMSLIALLSHLGARAASASDPNATYTMDNDISFDELIQRSDRSDLTSIPIIWHRGLHAVGTPPPAVDIKSALGGIDSAVWFYLASSDSNIASAEPIQENSVLSYRSIFNTSNADFLIYGQPVELTTGVEDGGAVLCLPSQMNTSDSDPDCPKFSNFPNIAEADPRRTSDGYWYAHHDTAINRDKIVGTDDAVQFSSVTQAEFENYQTAYYSNVGADETQYTCDTADICNAATMDQVFAELTADGASGLLALHMHSQDDLIDLAIYMYQWEIDNDPKTLFDKSFFLIAVNYLGDDIGTSDLDDVSELWGEVNTEVKAGFSEINNENNIDTYPDVYVNVNLYYGTKNIDSENRDEILSEILSQYPVQNGYSGGDSIVKFLGFGTSDSPAEQNHSWDLNQDLQYLGGWAKSNGFHNVKASIHPEVSQTTTDQYCIRSTDGYPADETKDWCPSDYQARLMTFIMGLDMQQANSSFMGYADIQRLANRFDVEVTAGNGQEAPTMIASDRPLLDLQFIDLGFTKSTPNSSPHSGKPAFNINSAQFVTLF